MADEEAVSRIRPRTAEEAARAEAAEAPEHAPSGAVTAAVTVAMATAGAAVAALFVIRELHPAVIPAAAVGAAALLGPAARARSTRQLAVRAGLLAVIGTAGAVVLVATLRNRNPDALWLAVPLGALPVMVGAVVAAPPLVVAVRSRRLPSAEGLDRVLAVTCGWLFCFVVGSPLASLVTRSLGGMPLATGGVTQLVQSLALAVGAGFAGLLALRRRRAGARAGAWAGLAALQLLAGVGWAADDLRHRRTMTGIAQIALGHYHGCALREGRVWCWGDGPWAAAEGAWNPLVPTEIPGLDGVTSLVAGKLHTCALRADGSVWCWGDVAGARPSAVPGVEGATQIAAGGRYTCAVMGAGAVQCWGAEVPARDARDFDRGIAVPPPALEVLATRSYACARTADAIRCWGHVCRSGEACNGCGPAEVRADGPASTLTSMATFEGRICAVRSTGDVLCAPHAVASTPRCEPSQRLVPDGTLGGAAAFAADGRESCVARDGRVRCGSHDDPSREEHALDHVASLATGLRTRCAVLTDGTARCWGSSRAGATGQRVRHDVDEPSLLTF